METLSEFVQFSYFGRVMKRVGLVRVPEGSQGTLDLLRLRRRETFIYKEE